MYTVYKIDTKNGKNWKLIYKKVGMNFATLYAKTATAFIIFLCILKKSACISVYVVIIYTCKIKQRKTRRLKNENYKH